MQLVEEVSASLICHYIIHERLYFQQFFSLISSLTYSKILHRSISVFQLHYIKKLDISMVTRFTKEPP